MLTKISNDNVAPAQSVDVGNMSAVKSSPPTVPFQVQLSFAEPDELGLPPASLVDQEAVGVTPLPKSWRKGALEVSKWFVYWASALSAMDNAATAPNKYFTFAFVFMVLILV